MPAERDGDAFDGDDGPLFDLDALFDRDYLEFYQQELNDDVSDDEAEVIAMLADLQPDDRVLDVPCGHGRIARRLAQRGAKVTGVDRSALFVERAREDARRHGVDVDYRQGDMLALDAAGEFDLLVCWFTSFGYYDDDTLRATLRRMHAALAPGGRLLLETMNVHEPGLTDHETSHTKELRDEHGTHFLIDRSRFDPLDGRIHCRRVIARRDRPLRELEYRLRLFAFPELRQWLRDAGFRDVHAFGDEGEIFRVDSRRLIVTAGR